jgi:hypothetical protein
MFSVIFEVLARKENRDNWDEGVLKVIFSRATARSHRSRFRRMTCGGSPHVGQSSPILNRQPVRRFSPPLAKSYRRKCGQ